MKGKNTRILRSKIIYQMFILVKRNQAHHLNNISTKGFVESNIHETCPSFTLQEIRQVVSNVANDSKGRQTCRDTRVACRIYVEKRRRIKPNKAGGRNEASIKLYETNRRNGVIRLPANAIIDTRNEPMISNLACVTVTRAI